MEITFSDAINNDSVGNEMMNGYARDLCMYVCSRALFKYATWVREHAYEMKAAFDAGTNLGKIGT
jgi:hypothetical protein